MASDGAGERRVAALLSGRSFARQRVGRARTVGAAAQRLALETGRAAHRRTGRSPQLDAI